MITDDTTTERAAVNKHLAHRDDPQSSKDAAAALDPNENAHVKRALLDLLREQSSAPFEVQSLYQLLRTTKGWPKVQPHSVNRRLSELKNAGLIRGTGEFVPTPYGAKAERLEIVPEPSSTSGDHCLLRVIDGRPCAVHYDCDDYADGTVTDVTTGEQVSA